HNGDEQPAGFGKAIVRCYFTDTRSPRFEGEEKSIGGGASSTVPVKNGMMPARQPVHDQVRKKGGESREKHGQLEHDREKRRHRCPVERFSVYDHRINEPGGTEFESNRG